MVGGHDPIRVDDDRLIVRLRELHECHERSILPVGRASRARRPETCDARASRLSLCTENVWRGASNGLRRLCSLHPTPVSLPGEGSTHLRGCGMTAVDVVDGARSRHRSAIGRFVGDGLDEGAVHMQITTIGLDIAKNVFARAICLPCC